VQKYKWWERRSSFLLLDITVLGHSVSFVLCYSRFYSFAQYSMEANVYFNLSVNVGALLVRDAGTI
jgi:hypothetical protein